VALFRRPLPLLSLLILALGAGTAFSAPCKECHGEWIGKMQALGSQHSPFQDGDCTSCHAEHGDAKKLMLTSQGAKLCFECHDDPAAGGKKVHSVIADSGCLDCHNPHASANKKLLVKPAGKLCFECHDDPAAGGKKKVHSVIADSGCLDCHSPHSSANPKLTLKPGAKLCAECHDVPKKEEPVSHTALDDGCSGCHDPHSSAQEKLLLKPYKNDKNVKVYKEQDYAICFECHEASMITNESDPEVTRFRNGAVNLHTLHVMGPLEASKYGIKKRGRPHACGVCHSPHGSDQEFVLIRQYDCGEVFCFTLNFTKQEDGGFCRVGCHKPLAYSRSGKVEALAGEASPQAPKQ